MRCESEQAQIIDTADCIIMDMDVRNGLTAADEAVAQPWLRRSQFIILAVNKCDGRSRLHGAVRVLQPRF